MKHESSASRIVFDGHDVGALHKQATSHLATIVFGHGAGAGMYHSTLENITDAFADVGLGSLRYNFPYMEAGKGRVDAKAVSTSTVKYALEYAKTIGEGPFLLGGHSFGGRMSLARYRRPRLGGRWSNLRLLSSPQPDKTISRSR